MSVTLPSSGFFTIFETDAGKDDAPSITEATIPAVS